jgi:hypothetical protein
MTLTDVRIIDSHKSPSMTSGSAPLMRGDPARRTVPARRTPGRISLSKTTASSAGSLAAIADHFMIFVYRETLTFKSSPSGASGHPLMPRTVRPPRGGS